MDHPGKKSVGKAEDVAASRVDELLAEYFRRVESGVPIDREEFLKQHPESADALRSYFEGADLVDGLAVRRTPPLPSLHSAETIAPQGQAGAQLVAGPFSRLPTPFGRFRVDKLLGRGAMGAVYLAWDTQLERPVALKVPKVADMDEEVISRLLREARAAAILSHPHICRVYDVGTHENMPFIAMEYIEGRPLSAFIDPENLLDDRRCAGVVRKLALALAEAHAKGIIHRDLKPANILINHRGEPILMDFGLARMSRSDDGRATQSGMLIGSPAYMSPEQANGETNRVGPRSDIYGLGVLLFELLTTELPFQGSVLTILSQIASKEPPAPSSFRPGLDVRLDAICQKMMAKNPDDRFPSMSAVEQELGNWLKTEPIVLPPKKDAVAKETSSTPVDDVVSQERRARKLLDEQNYEPAIPILTKLSALKEPQHATIAAWAKDVLPTAKKKFEDLHTRAANACEKARASLKQHDYAAAVQGLENIPQAARSSELRQLLSEATDLYDDVVHLQDEIKEAVTRKKYDGLLPLVRRFLKLKPDHPKMLRLARDLERNRAERAVANFKETRRFFDVAGRLVEPKEIALGVAIVTSLFIGVGAMVRTYFTTSGYSDTNGALVVNDPNVERNTPNTGPEGNNVGEKVEGNVQSPITIDRLIGGSAGEVRRFTDLQIRFRWCPAGRFTMGGAPTEVGRDENEKQVEVALSNGFWIQETEATQAQWRGVMGTTPWMGPLYPEARKDGADFPVTVITWNEATAFCNALDARERKVGSLPDGWEIRLPTEAEWEYACRAGTATAYSFGEEARLLDEYAWWFGNAANVPTEKFTHRVATKKPNPWGLFDMHGNVFEWCIDNYSQSLPGGPDPVVSNSNGSRIHRGGSWGRQAFDCRSAKRHAPREESQWPDVGFRVVLAQTRNSTERGFETERTSPVVDWISLFNGKDLTGWNAVAYEGGGQTQPGTWGVTPEGALRVSGTGHEWLRSPKVYGDFDLTAEFRIDIGQDGGIHFLVPETPTAERPLERIELNIVPERSLFDLGTTYDGGGTVVHAPIFKPTGQWNTIAVRHRAGRFLEADLGGTTHSRLELSNPKYAKLPTRGYVGFSNWGGLSRGVEYRNIRIKELGDAKGMGSIAPKIGPDRLVLPSRIIADWRFGTDDLGNPVVDSELVASAGRPAHLHDASGQSHRGFATSVSGLGTRYTQYSKAQRQRADFDGFAMRTGKKYGAVWFPESASLRRNSDFAVWARINIQAIPVSNQETLICRPFHWWLNVTDKGRLAVFIGSWNGSTQDVLGGTGPDLRPFLGKWTDVAFVFEGDGADDYSDLIRVYLNGKVMLTVRGIAKLGVSDHLHLGTGGGGRGLCEALFDRVLFYEGCPNDEQTAALSQSLANDAYQNLDFLNRGVSDRPVVLRVQSPAVDVHTISVTAQGLRSERNEYEWPTFQVNEIPWIPKTNKTLSWQRLQISNPERLSFATAFVDDLKVGPYGEYRLNMTAQGIELAMLHAPAGTAEYDFAIVIPRIERTVAGRLDPTWRGNWKLKFYEWNKSLHGEPPDMAKVVTLPPKLEREIPTLNLSWWTSKLFGEIREDFVAVVAERTFDCDSGLYRVGTISDDGIRVWIDGRLVVDDWRGHLPELNSNHVELKKGRHTMRVEYFESINIATLAVGLLRIE